MSVHLEDGVIRLEGACGVEEAEPLSALLQAQSGPIDMSQCRQAHSAVLQVLLAFAPPIRGLPLDPLLQQALRSVLPSGEP